MSVNFGGLKFGVLYGFLNSSQFLNNCVYSVGVLYIYVGFNIGVGYLQLNNDILGFMLVVVINGVGVVVGDNMFVGKCQCVFGGGLNYMFGLVMVGFVFM